MNQSQPIKPAICNISRFSSLIQIFLLVAILPASSNCQLIDLNIPIAQALADILSIPSELPSGYPSHHPTQYPSLLPSYASGAPTVSSNPSESPVVSPSASPTDMPSSLPTKTPNPSMSLLPTPTPSLRPSYLPSNVPSYVPSNGPSMDPSHSPSDGPSSAPSSSLMPSLSPTQGPTTSVYPSLTPSVTPTESMKPSPSPSLLPSSLPSNSLVPSLAPSTMPTKSSRPTSSARPSTSPSEMPSERPSLPPSHSPMPSSLPTTAPSNVPTSTPSGAPSLLPSIMPTDSPSPFPSVHPTEMPSAEPSKQPSQTPSSEPSANPSTAPSVMPSSSPTLECHDNAFYKSPINNLTCSDHAGTVCVQWRFLGLNTTSLGELIENCPETCDIPCGSFSQFGISISYLLANVPGLLDNESKERLESMSLDYLIEYVQNTEPDIIFELDDVVLTFQTELIPARRMRSLVEQSLEVSFTFSGFTIGLNTDQVTKYLISGINSSPFTSMIRSSGDPFFANAQASSAVESDQASFPALVRDEADKGTSPATVVVSTLVSVSIVAFGFGALFYHRRSGQWVPKIKMPALGDDRMARQGGPGATINWPSSPPPGSFLSFDDSHNPSVTVNNSGTGLIRLIASLSLTRSKSSTSPDRSSNSGSPESYQSQDISPMSEVTDKSIQEVHPLANIIPPMIVIDNIDDQNDSNSCSSDKQHNSRQKEVVPSMRVGASSAFIAALNECRKPHTPNTFAGILYNTDAFGDDLNLAAYSNVEDTNRVLSPLGIIIDSDSDDDTSVASTPVTPSRRTPVPLRRTVSSSALETLDKRKTIISPATFTFQSPAGSTPNPDVARPAFSRFSFRSETDEDSSLGCPPNFGPSPLTEVQTTTGQFSESHHGLSVINTSTPDNRSEADGSRRSGRTSSSPIDSARLMHSIWSLSPIAKVIKESTPRTLNRKLLPKGKKRASGENSINSEEGGGVANGQSVEFSDSGRVSGDLRLEFEAPSKGQLGLVIEAKPEVGPIVHAIKDYSPLFGLVKKGDKIVEVNGKNTSQSSLSEITRMLAVRPGRRGTSNLRIVVARPIEKNPTQPISLKRNSSYTSSSQGSHRDYDDADEASPSGGESTSDDLTRGRYYSDHSDDTRDPPV